MAPKTRAVAGLSKHRPAALVQQTLHPYHLLTLAETSSLQQLRGWEEETLTEALGAAGEETGRSEREREAGRSRA